MTTNAPADPLGRLSLGSRYKKGYSHVGYYRIGKREDFKMHMIPTLKITVGFIYADYGSHYEALGTGFFAWVRQDDKRFFYLITCKHVVDKEIEAETQLYVRLNRLDIDNVGFVPLDNDWLYHTDKAVDIAVTQFEPHPDVPCEFEAVDIEYVFLPGRPADYIFEGFDVTFIGLLTSIPGDHINTPVYRYGHISMMLDHKLKGKYGDAEYLLIECVAYHGNSGAPLWIAIPSSSEGNQQQYTVFIIGVMTEIFLRQEIDAEGYGRTAYHSGLSLAVPISYVREILLGEKLMDDRKKRVEQDKSPNDRSIPISSRPIEVEGKPFERQDFLDALDKAIQPGDCLPETESQVP